MSNPEPITGPHCLIPGRFYHHAGAFGVHYFCAAQYWNNTATGLSEPIPGTEQLYLLNGDMPGALVVPPDDGSTEEFWKSFYPAPGLEICSFIASDIKSVRKTINEIMQAEDFLGARWVATQDLFSMAGMLDRAKANTEQLGHEKYGEAVPVEVAAKNNAIRLYHNYVNLLVSGLAEIRDMAMTLREAVPAGTRSSIAADNIGMLSTRLMNRSPFHPGKKDHP